MASEIGFPVVLKGQGIAHKTEAGAVHLNLSTEDEVRSRASDLPTDTILVEQMITRGVAELLVGVVRDPAHGYVLTLAAGGTLTELMDDRVSLLVPSSEADVRSALQKLKISRVLAGYRGQASADLSAIAANIMAVQAYVEAHHPTEVEINPLICCADAAYVADALIRTGGNHE